MEKENSSRPALLETFLKPIPTSVLAMSDIGSGGTGQELVKHWGILIREVKSVQVSSKTTSRYTE